MARLRLLLPVAAALLCAPHACAAGCSDPPVSSAYAARVHAAVASGRDVWGERLLRAPNGPTYAAARALLRPLWWARGPHGTELTATGAYYLPFAQPAPQGATSVALHVADGSQIVAQRVGGASLGVFVGSRGDERYGSCLGRLAQPALADGYLPILRTRYADAAGVVYRQESFAALVGGRLVSYLRIDADARRATASATLRLAGTGTAPLRARIVRGTTRTVTFGWRDTGGGGRGVAVDVAAYAEARAAVVAFWQAALARGATVSVPEPRVEDAERALTIQDLELTWRYSIGNPYEEFSFPESVDVARVLAGQGQTAAAEAILRTSLTRAAAPYPNWKKGSRLVAVAEVYRLSGDAAFVDAVSPTLRSWLPVLARQIRAGGGLLGRERYSSDIPDSVLGTHSQAVVWQGLTAMADVWTHTGQPAAAAQARALATRLGAALRRAIASSERRLPDGSLFLPVELLGGERPYGSLMEARLGSYWNLVMPYALASGIVPAGSPAARGILRYQLLHGSRLLGLVRAGGYALYGHATRFPVSGTDAVYDDAEAQFLADEDEPDLLDLSLYGHLAVGMTDGTFVSGEAASVTPLPGGGRRSMYLPPNAASDAAFLETLRLALVHETRDAAGHPRDLQLAFSTPRPWLAPGRRIAVAAAPTSFGPVAYTLVASAASIQASVDEPTRLRPHAIALRLRLPAGTRLGRVLVDGRPWAGVDRATATVRLPVTGGHLDVTALVTRARHG